MATNPMQRKARTSFWTGFFVAVVIAAVIIVGLIYLLMQTKKEQEEIVYVNAYVLTQSVGSGQELDSTMFSMVSVPKTTIPGDYISILPENSIAKVALKSGTVLANSLIAESEDIVTEGDDQNEAQGADIRLQEYNMLVLPTQLTAGEYIDVRILLPNGQDFVVISKKYVIDADATTVWLRVSEDEILTLNSAIVEAYIMTGSKIYATTYVEPGIQEAAIVTYVPSNDVITLINSDANITNEAKAKLQAAYTSALRKLREEKIQKALDLYEEDALTNIEQNMQDDIANQLEARQQYFDSLNASY